MIELTGQIEQVTYFNEAPGFTVARLRIEWYRTPVTAVGRLLDPRPGEMLTMTGEWTVHRTFGEQFKVSEFKRHVPATAPSILNYLGSGLIRGLGPEMASRIMDQFGDRTLEIIANDIQQLQKVRIPGRFGLDPIDDIQVLTPMHRAAAGADERNRVQQEALNPGQAELMRGNRTFRLHDKVMQICNNYDKDVFNGDLGRIAALYENGQGLEVCYDGRSVPYAVDELDVIVTAFAVSVHKSQGSEFPAVVIPVLAQHYVLLQRNLIYTAITRGRRLVALVGTRKALAMAVVRWPAMING